MSALLISLFQKLRVKSCVNDTRSSFLQFIKGDLGRSYVIKRSYAALLQDASVYPTITSICQTHRRNLEFSQLRLYFKTEHCFSKNSLNSDKSLTYEVASEETLESLAEYFEELLSTHLHESESDVSLTNGVLTIQLGDTRGTYVINKQSPNKQIWLSSPISGPKRYDLVDGKWVYRHDGMSLHKLLNKEISDILHTSVDFTSCAYGK